MGTIIGNFLARMLVLLLGGNSNRYFTIIIMTWFGEVHVQINLWDVLMDMNNYISETLLEAAVCLTALLNGFYFSINQSKQFKSEINSAWLLKLREH